MKNAKLIIDGKEIDVQISEENLENLIKPDRITGYERSNCGQYYYYDNGQAVEHIIDTACLKSDILYERANYYSNVNIANNNVRADILMRQLRRFAVEHRKIEINWTNIQQRKYYIYYHHVDAKLQVESVYFCQNFHQIYFDTRETAELAIKIFKDELLWYFTEYCDSL